MTDTQSHDLDQAIDSYGANSKQRKRLSKTIVAGFGAAAAGGLLSCGQADADIVATGPAAGMPMSVPVNGSVAVDIDQDGDVDISFRHLSNPGFAIYPVTDPGTETAAAFLLGGTSGSYLFPMRMNKGDIISAGAGSFVNTSTGWMGWASAQSAAVTDPWGILSNAPNTVTGFVGVEFSGKTASGGSGTVYGWIQLQMFVNPSTTDPDGFTPGDFVLLGMAYENMGNPIAAGAVPEPAAAGTIALTTLALGASGIRRRRKNKAS